MGFRILLALLPIFLIAACAGPLRQPEVLAPGFPGGIERIALAPVVFGDAPIDQYHGTQVAEEIVNQTQKALSAKGYQVRSIENEAALFPFGGAGSPPFQIPSDADALLTIRLDHFLDAALYDQKSRNTLDVYATATLTGRAGDLLWRDKGVGRGIRTSAAPDPIQDFTTAASLVDSLFATLPPAAPH